MDLISVATSRPRKVITVWEQVLCQNISYFVNPRIRCAITFVRKMSLGNASSLSLSLCFEHFCGGCVVNIIIRK